MTKTGGLGLVVLIWMQNSNSKTSLKTKPFVLDSDARLFSAADVKQQRQHGHEGRAGGHLRRVRMRAAAAAEKAGMK